MSGRMCKAERNCGFFYAESNARKLAADVSTGHPAKPVAVYAMAGAFHVYLAPERIEGFGDRLATYLDGRELPPA